MSYTPPIAELAFLLHYLVGTGNLQKIGHELDADLLQQVLAGAGAVAAGDFAPLNHAGDKNGAKLIDGKVIMPAGCVAAYQSFIQGGWNAVPVATEIGGMGLPWSVAYAVQEMFQGANIALALVTLLNQGAIELLATHGPEDINEVYLAKLVSGAWTGTMNLTEPQAGSDVGAIRMTATPEGGFFRLRGQKIYISYGDHDLAENILHFVLARLPDAPEGSRGLSLFMVPKILVKKDGTLGKANDVRVVSLEHKLGQHASPTCVMAYGDHEGAIGYLIGEAHGGITAMFTMMNNARIGVGIQGLGVAERAYQAAVAFAKTRVQGRALHDRGGDDIAIIEHPDVKRMLLSMRAQIEAARAFMLATGYMADRSRMVGDVVAHARLELFTPIVKAWLTDLANDITSTAIQVCGGMGYIEEAGLSQHYRDARVLAIYEGTNGIQANDLIFRKLARDRGVAMYSACAEIKYVERELVRVDNTPENRAIRDQLAFARTDLEAATQTMLDLLDEDSNAAAACAMPYLRLAGYAMGGLYLGHAALQAAGLLRSGNSAVPAEYLRHKLQTMRFYADHILPTTTGLKLAVGKHDCVNEVAVDYF